MIAMTHIKNYAKLGYSSSRILAETNNRLSGQNRGALTVSVFLGILNLRTGLMEYVDGLQNDLERFSEWRGQELDRTMVLLRYFG